MDTNTMISNNLKAKSFLFVFNIRSGLLFVAFTHFILGVFLYSIMHYLHPSLTWVALFLFGINVACAVFGFFGAWRRSVVIESIYLVLNFFSVILILMSILDMAELVRFLPKAPELHNPSFALLHIPLPIKSKIPNYKIMMPQFIPKDNLTLFDSNLSYNSPSDLVPDLQTGNQTTYPTRVEDPFSPQKLNAEGGLQGNKQGGGTEVAPGIYGNGGNESVGQVIHGGTEEGANNGLESKTPQSSGSNDNLKGANVIKDDKSTSTVPSNTHDSTPYAPPAGETEGEGEEVSKEELPPETKDLSPEGRSEVVVMYKIQKRPLKMLTAGFLTIVLMFNVYCYWVAVTFVLNRCTSLDELASHPEQFTPLVD